MDLHHHLDMSARQSLHNKYLSSCKAFSHAPAMVTCILGVSLIQCYRYLLRSIPLCTI